MRSKKLPKFLQPFLWSVKIEELDWWTDRIYIIHQILAFGDVKALKWLFKNYSREEIKRVFLEHPMRIYRNSGLNLANMVIFDSPIKLNNKNYVVASHRSLK